ncbi:glycosyltransferase family 4 protein [Roseovarius sp. S4756]|uniref:glycosyltransferase family 4 protein n=1 Tax=Roseovarius maritimus TaxID=3342637 RepID=UPI003728CCE3
MTRVLQITDKGPGGGGIRRVVEAHEKLIGQTGGTCLRLILTANPGQGEAPLDVRSRLPRQAQVLKALRNAARGADVIHLHLGFSSVSPDFISEAASLAPLVVNLHDVTPFETLPGWSDPSPANGWRDRLAQRWFLPVRRDLLLRIWHHSSAIIAPSTYLAELARNAGAPANRLWHIPHPVWAAEDPVLPPSRRDPVILYAGMIAAHKGAPMLLDALAHVKLPTARLRIVGDGPLRPQMERRARRLGMADRVEFVGQVSAEMVWKELCHARVLAHPSQIAEGLGLIGIEALQAMCPVVGFATGGAVDWLLHERTGLRPEPASPAALGAALERVLSEDALADRLGAEGRRLAIKAFAPARVSEALSACYDQVLGQMA